MCNLLCQYEKVVYPKNIETPVAGYMIAYYKPCELIKDSTGQVINKIKAVGTCLPMGKGMRYDMHGRWKKDKKYGLQYEVETYDEIIEHSKEGILSYLASGQIKGIGPKIAQRIYDAFGLKTLEILDHEPEKLLDIPGISEGKLKKICESYTENRAARDVIAYLTPFGITVNRAIKLYKEYGGKAIEMVKHHPYKLCDMAGIGFKTADDIAMRMGLKRVSPERADEGMLYVLSSAEKEGGHLCLEKHEFIEASLKLLDTPGLTEEMLVNRAARMVHEGKLIAYKGYVYRPKTALVEEHLATMIRVHLKHTNKKIYENLDDDIADVEKRMRITFAPEQKAAIKTALTEGISIITGGPGTGKTLIQRAILDIYKRKNPKGVICCCAPTGQAARRMEQSTSVMSSTVHKALGIYAGNEITSCNVDKLEADFIIVDESSMLDVYLAEKLLFALKVGAQVVFIGDADQLPSVEPGAVLSEMIESKCIPVVYLDKVFRQDKGSQIAMNALYIRHGLLNLDEGKDFFHIRSGKSDKSANYILDEYEKEVMKYGIDNVAILTPLKKKTAVCSNELNARIRDRINPADASKAEVTSYGRVFRCGDKVMQVKNFNDVNNGDHGYITDIHEKDGEMVVIVTFDANRIKEYDLSMLNMLELGYAITIHKSQGAEYKSVIINLQLEQRVMLSRALVYTAITRGREKVTIIGDKRALCRAIENENIKKRGTCLALRIQEAA